MSRETDSDDQAYLEDVRKGLLEAVAFWSPERKVERETWTVKTFLGHLGLEYAESEVEPEPNEPPDIVFRDARFEIKEMLDSDRRRHDEYRKKLEKAKSAKSALDLMEQYTPQDLTYREIGDRVTKILQDASEHYAPKAVAQLDMLIYVNLLRRIVDATSPIPDASLFAPFGWRSVSVVRSSGACVLCARADTPGFIRLHVGRPVSRPEAMW